MIHVHMQTYDRFKLTEDIFALIEAGKLNLQDAYSHIIPLKDINHAMSIVKSKECIKVVVEID